MTSIVDILQNKFVNQAKQFNWGLENTNINTKWILRIDADEVLTENLVKKIQENLKNYPPDISGITINRTFIFFGKNITCKKLLDQLQAKKLF